jgi:hypothetical protein
MPSTLRVQLQLRIISDDDTVIRDEVILQLGKSDDRLETVGLCLEDSKDLLGWLQHAEAQAYVNRHRCCSACRLRGKGQYPSAPRSAMFRSQARAFTAVGATRRTLQSAGRAVHRAHRPGAAVSGEPLVESRWASLISFGMTAALLKDVLPVAGTPETVRQHLHKVAARQDTDLGTGEPGLRDDGPAADQPSPVPREAVIVGIDGGYLRNWHDKRKKFEVIVGKSMAEDRDDRYFGLVRSQDAAPKRRLREVLRRQGLPVDQPVTVLTDGGDSVRALASDLPAGSEHHLDWFHVAMRLTVLEQYAKGLAQSQPDRGGGAAGPSGAGQVAAVAR